MSRLVKREQCPRCFLLGRDRAKDNLGVYDDGHKYCFSCQYFKPAKLEARLLSMNNPDPKINPNLNFPSDYARYIPKDAAIWLNKYKITGEEITQHKFGWSEEKQMLVFPVYGDNEEVIMWQGRSFGQGPKYYTKGPASDIMHIIYPPSLTKDRYNGMIILTEGLLDAIKVGRVVPAMPLWGSTVPLKLLQRLSDRFSTVGIWLDPDKTIEAVKAAIRASQYMEAFAINSCHDPKCYDINMIDTYLCIGHNQALKPEKGK